ncbi:MAG: RdgB/HAM1 family non-canonical purine NTP pyrophosphatase [Pseudomonadota bacterium]
MTQQIVLATGNRGKLAELSALLADLPVALINQAELHVDSVPETGTTFVENAIIKARHAARQTGLPALADDSGLEVNALNGAPGIRSARYAGESATDADNIDRLLEALSECDDRSAIFRCVIVFMRHADDPMPLIVSGSWRGEVALARAGDQGFGYDPVFLLPELGKTAADLSAAEKNARSHRGQALRALRTQLQVVLPL